MTTQNVENTAGDIVGGYKYGWHDPEFKAVNKPVKGLSKEVVAQISELKNEPQWMRDFRLRSLELFEEKPMPTGFWGGNIQGYPLDFQDIYYYVKPMEGQGKTWEDIPEAERKFLAGVGAQYDSEVVYHKIREDLEKLGVMFMDMDSGLREHPEI